MVRSPGRSCAAACAAPFDRGSRSGSRRRLRWPLPLSAGTCQCRSCRASPDDLGDHQTACSRSGLLKLRARPVEKVWPRVMREAGARVREDTLLTDIGVSVDPADGRKVEVVASGLPVAHTVLAAINATMMSPPGGLSTQRMSSVEARWREGAKPRRIFIQNWKAARAFTSPQLASTLAGAWTRMLYSFLQRSLSPECEAIRPNLSHAFFRIGFV